MNPQVFGKEHLIYITISILTTIVVCVLSKLFVRSEKLKH